MIADIRESAPYRGVEALYQRFRQPGSGVVSDAAELSVSADGKRAVFAASIADTLEGVPPTRICSLDLSTGDLRGLTFGPNVDRLPRFSPDGRHVAFLSDCERAGRFQLYLLDVSSGAARCACEVEGAVEDLQWSPDGARILLRVVSSDDNRPHPSWMPVIESADRGEPRRGLWIFELATGRARGLGALGPGRHGPGPHGPGPHGSAVPGPRAPGLNVWDAVWCGNDSVALIASAGSREGHWYGARLYLIYVATGIAREVLAPHYQLGCLAGSPDGKCLALTEGLCSDRQLVSGDLHLLDTDTGRVSRIETDGVDVTCTEWRSSTHLLVAGHRGLETVVGVYDTRSSTFTGTWSSFDPSTTGVYATVAGRGAPGDFAFISESFNQSPEVGVVEKGVYRAVRHFDLGYNETAQVIGATERVTWSAPDGLDIEGWLLRPRGAGPHPLVMNIHGGPVWQWKPHWLGRRAVHLLMLVARGYAIFMPNPRGSSGRGQAFARRVLGDVGGADALDYLSGIDFLVERGIAHRERLGVMGASYGGSMSAWLITQDPRFAAAIPIVPATNRVSQHLISQYPEFVRLFMADDFNNAGGLYHQRSPVMHAHKASTPTLSLCGALDRCTPPGEAMQFHRALRERDVKSVLVTYPEEGHGVRSFPALIDFGARILGWFEAHLTRPAS